METSVRKTVGKHIRGNRYFHVSALEGLAPLLREQVQLAAAHAGLRVDTDFNVVKIDEEKSQISLLSYEHFFEHPFPCLKYSYVVDLTSDRVKHLRYDLSENPPILHRKELLLPHDHPQRHLFAKLTKQLEAAGLFREARRIGFARVWEERLQTAGYEVKEHQLVALNGAPQPQLPLSETPARHRTALQRYALSTPMQALHRHGYLDGSGTVFDYGCGKGDDVRILRHNGFTANGWDPHFAPDTPKTRADIVNLGFVLNVIEDPAERARVLRDAYALADKVLAVAVMLTGRAAQNGETFGDGVRTSHNTFQKYFTQGELRDYLLSVLDKEPVAVGPGVFFVFKDESEEQHFFAQRVRARGGLDRLIGRLPKPTRAEREQAFYETHQAMLDFVWETWLELGRKPEPSEVRQQAEIERVFGSLGKALRFLERFHGDDAVHAAFRSRKADLTVYFALQQFEQRKTSTALSDELRRDVRVFFGGYQNAQAEARQMLFSAGKRDVVRQLCREAAHTGLGWLEKDRALYLHTSLVERLPAVLRVYIGCASYLYGDVPVQI